MNIPDLSLFIIAIINTALAMLVVLYDRKNPINLWFGAFSASLALWSGSLLILRSVTNTSFDVLILKSAYVSAIFIAVSLYTFTHYFPQRAHFTIWEKRATIFLTALLVLFIFTPGILIQDVVYIGETQVGIQEPVGYILFSLYFVLYFFGALYMLFRRWQTAAPLVKTRVGYIAWSVLAAGIFGLFFNLVLPSPWIQEWDFIWIGPIFTLIIAIAVVYAIAQYNLLNIRLLTAEISTAVVAFLLFVQALSSTTREETIFRTIFFLIGSFFGYYLIRSVRREEAQRWKLEKLTKELAETNKKLEDLNLRKSEFVSLATHQLRSPVTIIKGYSSMLLEGSMGELNEKAREAVSHIFQMTNNFARVIEDFLTISRIEQNKLEYNYQKDDLGKILMDAVEEMRPAFKGKKLDVAAEIHGDIFPVVVDVGKIHQVIGNLLDNALKYTERGMITAGLSLNKEKNLYVISVTDTGLGMSEDTIKNLFEKFSRANEARTKNAGGTGIGLYVATKIVNGHRGRIWAESAGEGKGSTFFVELPKS